MDKSDQRKKSIMVFMLPEWSAFNSSFQLTVELAKSGYRVFYFGPPKFKKYVTDQGFEYREFDIDDFARNRFRNLIENSLAQYRLKHGRRPGSWKLFRRKIQSKEQIRRDIMGQIEEAVQAEPPDLVLLDPVMYKYSPPFLKLGIPILNLSISLISIANSTVPPPDSGIIPNYKLGPLYRLINLLAWFKNMLPGLYVDISSYLSMRWGFGFRPFFNIKKEIRKLGGRLKRTVYKYYWLQVPTLITSPRELDFPRVSQENSRCYIGTCLHLQRKEILLDWDGIDRDKPLVYCTLGSYSRQWKYRTRLYEAVIEVIRQRPQWQLILQMPDTAEADRFGPLPRRIRVAEWVPHIDIFPHTDLVICHGGFGTLREALYFGVPLLLFPCGIDNPGNAARAVYHKLGLRGNIKNITPPRLSRLIDGVENSEAIQASVKRMQRIFREQESCRRGVDFIERFLSTETRIL